MDLHTDTINLSLKMTSLEPVDGSGRTHRGEDLTVRWSGSVSLSFIGRRPRCNTLLPGLHGRRDIRIVTNHPAFKKNPPDSYNFKSVIRVED